MDPRKEASPLERKETRSITGGSLWKDDKATPFPILCPVGDGIHHLLSGCSATPSDEEHLLEPEDCSQEGGVLVLLPDNGRTETSHLKPADDPDIKEGCVRSNNQNRSNFWRKEISSDLWGEEAKANPDQESCNEIVEHLKNSSDSRSWFGFIHSNQAKSSTTPSKEERGDENEDSDGEEDDSTKKETNLVQETNNILLPLKRGWKCHLVKLVIL